MKLLALDTSTDACSVALLANGDTRVRHAVAPRRHGELVLSFVDELMGEADLEPALLDALVLGRGPGSFTGLRIGAGVVQGIAFAAELPVACVSSLATLAQGCEADRVICLQDARMGEVYAGAFERHGSLMQAAMAERVCAPEAVPVPDGGGWLGVGSGFDVHGDALRHRLGKALARTDRDQRHPHAQHLLELGRAMVKEGETVEASRALPVYLRDEVAHRGGGQ